MNLSAPSCVGLTVRRIAIGFGLVGVTALGLGIAASQSPAQPTRDACGFDFPVGPPDATGYYDAQPFGANDHLGNDWNGLGGGDTDFGFPVFAVADGLVVEATDQQGGWGNVIRIEHTCGDRVESLYAHLHAMHVVAGTPVVRGQQIGTIGNAGGQYRAHLHFELRDRTLPLGAGYAAERTGYVDPTDFIKRHRPVAR
ncbi:MAG TPA: peptidoglycan DD-metalloendopeptidase family protein [Kofleriaceae bacterium]